ncbi:hypothetical protein LV79_001699 [Actinokineospora globicatena]|nr:hypothetical protein [Actinokineospora globicatena]
MGGATRGFSDLGGWMFMLVGYRSCPHVDLCGAGFKIHCRGAAVDWPRDAPRRGWGPGRAWGWPPGVSRWVARRCERVRAAGRLAGALSWGSPAFGPSLRCGGRLGCAIVVTRVSSRARWGELVLRGAPTTPGEGLKAGGHSAALPCACRRYGCRPPTQNKSAPSSTWHQRRGGAGVGQRRLAGGLGANVVGGRLGPTLSAGVRGPTSVVLGVKVGGGRVGRDGVMERIGLGCA